MTATAPGKPARATSQTGDNAGKEPKDEESPGLAGRSSLKLRPYIPVTIQRQSHQHRPTTAPVILRISCPSGTSILTRRSEVYQPSWASGQSTDARGLVNHVIGERDAPRQ